MPLSEMFGYVTTLRTLSSGRATSTMEFSHYAETPSNISESVIAQQEEPLTLNNFSNESKNKNKTKILRSQFGGQIAEKIVKTVKSTEL